MHSCSHIFMHQCNCMVTVQDKGYVCNLQLLDKDGFIPILFIKDSANHRYYYSYIIERSIKWVLIHVQAIHSTNDEKQFRSIE